jgi:hypothetical protein
LSTGGPNWTEIVLAVVAVISILLNIWQYVESRRANEPRIKVKLYPTYINLDDLRQKVRQSSGLPGSPPPNCLALEVANHGGVPVNLNGNGILLTDGRNALPVDVITSGGGLPRELAPGKAYCQWVPIDSYARWLPSKGVKGTVRLVGVYRDQLGREYRSKPYEFDVDAWR